MKNRVFVIIILVLIGMFSMMIGLTSFFIVEDYEDQIAYHEGKYQVEDFDFAFEHGEYYTMYLYALSNENKEGELYAPTLEYEYFGHFYYHLMEYEKAKALNEDVSDEVAKVLFYEEAISLNLLKAKCEELKEMYHFRVE